MSMIMKKFTSMKEIKSEKYAKGDFLRNDLLKMIEDNLTINKEDDNLGILGKDDLVDKFVEVLSDKLIKMEISLLESISKNPAILKEYNSNPVDRNLLTLNEKVNQIIKESIEEEEAKLEEAKKAIEESEKDEDKVEDADEGDKNEE